MGLVNAFARERIGAYRKGMKRTGVAIILTLAFIGMADAAYLAKHELSGTPLVCNIQSLSGCNTVASSSFAQLFGIPIAVYGVVFYAVLFILAAIELVIFNKPVRRVIQVIAALGVIAEIWFTFVQVYLINALCVYCLASAVTAFLIFVFASMIEPFRYEESFRQRNVADDIAITQRLPMPPV